MPRAVPVLLLALAWPRAAAAVGDEEAQVGLQLAYAHLGGPGGLAALEGQYGLTDAWAARLSLAGAVFRDWRRGAALGSAGFTFAVDVSRLVPFLDLGAALLAADGRGHLGAEAGIGGEYLLAPRWALAVVARGRVFPLAFDGGGGVRWLLSVGVRLGWLL